MELGVGEEGKGGDGMELGVAVEGEGGDVGA